MMPNTNGMAAIAPFDAASSTDVSFLLGQMKKINFAFSGLDQRLLDTYAFSTAMLSDFVLLSSSSGKNNFEKANAAGAAITLDVIKWEASAP